MNCYAEHEVTGKTSGMSVFRLKSDFRFLRIKENGIHLIKYSQNMNKISIVSKGRLGSDKGLDNPSLNTGSKH